MSIRFFVTVVALLVSLCASTLAAEPRAISVDLQDRGFSTGIQLRSRASTTVFFSLPGPESLSQLRLKLHGQISAPNLFRGSLLVTANGQPVDSIAIKQADGLQPLDRDIAIDRKLIAANGALNIRFEAELLANGDPCANDSDIANIISILPTTGISFNINPDQIQSLVDAVRLLPHNAEIVLPKSTPLNPRAAQAALHLAVLMIADGINPRIQSTRDNSPAAIRLERDKRAPIDENAAVLVRDNDKLDIVIDPSRDVVALTKLWQMAPGTIIGNAAIASRSPNGVKPVGDNFREFSSLPPAQNIGQTGEWTLNFPLLAESGRLARSVKLRVAVAPDWSSEAPILTVYLNGQLVTAARLRPGDNEISFPLPSQALNFSNSLRLVVDRATERGYCVRPGGGNAVQIMPGSGVTFDDDSGSGFSAVARGLAKGGTVVLPDAARDPDVAGRYLAFAARLLAVFGSTAEDIDVRFGLSPSDLASLTKTAIIFEVAGSEGLKIPIPSRAESLNLPPVASSALAGLFSDPNGKQLRVVLSEPDQIPTPPALYLRGGGANALVSTSGVVWSDAPSVSSPLFGTLQNSASGLQSLAERYGLTVLIVLAVLVVIVFVARKVLVLYFRGRASR
ncbi:hypothetical protein DW352_18425 [Pseudolabrys taiwanensis]|uniref:Cyclic di-GMP-binding protein n=1 Tax=Pseudolabrys taiwanensis TaxID=331696 RepID=A0A345ZZH4_9HYPH|nr:cellulose biosynthesis cyclic di-GMP-binding regulatory protein BcsB [Pseudolabrys taiwanensis]AXK82321.1 hypothetical protein DW352_18425 [Pseudolabrys taiwanensis]